jgi:hypothetical protein
MSGVITTLRLTCSVYRQGQTFTKKILWKFKCELYVLNIDFSMNIFFINDASALFSQKHVPPQRPQQRATQISLEDFQNKA